MAAAALGDEALLVGAEMDVQCLGRQWEKLSTDPWKQCPPSACIPGARRVVRVLGVPQAGTNSRVFSLQF